MSDFRQPWIEVEDAILRDAYAEGGIHAARKALPHRSANGIHQRASKLGIKAARMWDRLADQRLRYLWDGLNTVDDIAHELGRTPGSVYRRAQVLGLGLGAPQGWESLDHAAKRVGYAPGALRRILKWAGVRIQPALSNPAMKPKYCFRIVEVSAVDDAVEEWLVAEPARVAAIRVGIHSQTLVKRLKAAGVKRAGARYFRLTADQVRQAVGP